MFIDFIQKKKCNSVVTYLYLVCGHVIFCQLICSGHEGSTFMCIFTTTLANYITTLATNCARFKKKTARFSVGLNGL